LFKFEYNSLKRNHIRYMLPIIMKNLLRIKYLILIIIVCTLNISCSQSVLESKYYFVNSGKLFSIEQQNDTLYEYRCDAKFNCRTKARKHYKIIKPKQKGNMTLLAVERLDSIPLSTKPIRDNRSFIIGIEKLSENKIKLIKEVTSYTQDSISKIPFELSLLENKFGFTYYEENYLKSLDSDFEIDKDFANEITESIKSTDKELIELYRNTVTGDMYGSGLTAELIAREMIKRNLSPILAKKKIDDVSRK